MKSAAAIITLSVCKVMMFSPSISLKCYLCDNAVYHPDPECDAIVNGQSEFLIKCPESSIKCSVFRTYDDGEKLISTRRCCLDSFDEHHCSYLDSSPMTCTSCSEDGCNNS